MIRGALLCLVAGVIAASTSFASAQNAAMRLLSLANPSAPGARVTLRAEVDGLGGGAPTGSVSFADGSVHMGSARLAVLGAGQAAYSAGGGHTCALSQTGGLKCWGDNLNASIGDGTATDRKTPVDVPGLTSGVVAVAAGDGHTCALTRAGGVKCWGENSDGEVGDGTVSQRKLAPAGVVGLANGVVAIAAGGNHSCALTATGGVKCWGYNGSGQLGDGTTSTRATPVNVVGLTAGVIAIAAGDRHTCALTRAGALKCWGDNIYGQIGDGATTNRMKPASVLGLGGAASAVSLGYTHSCALMKTGGVKCWGYNGAGQLGDGTRITRWTPVDVLGLTSTIVAIDVGSNHACALTAAGGVECWGENRYGQLGDTTTINRSTPVAVAGLASGVAALSAGNRHSCALTVGGASLCWGSDSDGRLGIGGVAPTIRTRPASTLSFAGLVRASAAFTTPALAAGSHAMKASYGGDAGHSASSGTLQQKVQ
ncbi:chromosome condensation regulator RCC1 [Methylosinus sp. Sm6]|uniref:RCC1 domain-containing protein n=1 Tax=Methylosinus sp. Sm6 TaxID=2866948 RepID=UPI00351D1EAE